MKKLKKLICCLLSCVMLSGSTISAYAVDPITVGLATVTGATLVYTLMNAFGLQMFVNSNGQTEFYKSDLIYQDFRERFPQSIIKENGNEVKVNNQGELIVPQEMVNEVSSYANELVSRYNISVGSYQKVKERLLSQGGLLPQMKVENADGERVIRGDTRTLFNYYYQESAMLDYDTLLSVPQGTILAEYWIPHSSGYKEYIQLMRGNAYAREYDYIGLARINLVYNRRLENSSTWVTSGGINIYEKGVNPQTAMVFMDGVAMGEFQDSEFGLIANESIRYKNGNVLDKKCRLVQVCNDMTIVGGTAETAELNVGAKSAISIPTADSIPVGGAVSVPVAVPTVSQGAYIGEEALQRAIENAITNTWVQAQESAVTGSTTIVNNYAAAPSIGTTVAAPVADSEVAQYTIGGLETVFPFCIPFDIYNLFKAFNASPQTPRFEIPLKMGNFLDYTFVVDFTPFNAVAYVLRGGIAFLFTLGLAIKTRDLIRG